VSFSHLTLPTRDVQATASFLEQTLGYSRDPAPANSPVETVWLNIRHGQQIHVVFVEDFQVSPFEGEFGRHIAVFQPLEHFPDLRRLLRGLGSEVFDPARPSPFARFFFREPINGYVFEVMDSARAGRPEGRPASAPDDER
jgi:catechol 2,3-dioxygenase-like lactoylglutathione lyase family enzyme